MKAAKTIDWRIIRIMIALEKCLSYYTSTKIFEKEYLTLYRYRPFLDTESMRRL